MKRTAILIFTLSNLILAACTAPLTQTSALPAPQTESQPNTNQPEQAAPAQATTYPIVDTNQTACYNNAVATACPESGQEFAGQDGNYQGNTPQYQNNNDGTVTDLVTGLMWSQTADLNGDGTINASDKLTYANALSTADSATLGGYDDWRLPTIKELYSLILFDGTDVSACMSGTCTVIPFIDADTFGYAYGDTSAGERVIDSQFATSTKYVSTTMNGDSTLFGVNFADGRIKGYGLTMPSGGEKTFFVLYVRGNPSYGINSYTDNGNGTITDSATGLTWSQTDSGTGMTWSEALNYCETSTASGFEDWRLPNAKELHSILDYSRSPATTGSAAIDPLFQSTAITVENGSTDFAAYWTSTTHTSSNGDGGWGAYLSFGSSLGIMNGRVLDVHGAGSQRSDPKAGDASQYAEGHGPQGDVVRIDNYARCVRGGDVNYVSGMSSAVARASMQIDSSGGIQQQGGQQPNGQNQTTGQVGGAQGGQGQTPPQEAINACSGLSSGSSCSFTAPNGTITGTCGTPPNSTQLACMPAGGRP